MTVLLKTPGDSTSFRVYIDNIGAATISSATAPGSVGSLTVGTVAIDNATTPKSVVVPVVGGLHGQQEQVPLTIYLSTGGPLVRSIVIRVDAS